MIVKKLDRRCWCGLPSIPALPQKTCKNRLTGKKKGIKPEHADRLRRILDRLNAASEIRDMNYPGSNLHKLGRSGVGPR